MMNVRLEEEMRYGERLKGTGTVEELLRNAFASIFIKIKNVIDSKLVYNTRYVRSCPLPSFIVYR